jgi:DNA helicase-2/ATP-dependent DNA helicase PcrA
MGASIPYQIARGTAFYDRKEVKDAVAYLRVLWNPYDEVNLRRIINTPTRGIGDTTLEHVQAFAAGKGIAFSPALRQAANIPALNTRAVNAIQNFVEMFGNWRQKIADADQQSLGFAPGVCDVVEMIIHDSGLEAYYKSEKTGDEERLANLYELVTAAQRFDDEQAALAAEEQLEGEEPPPRNLTDQIGRFLERISLVADVDGVSESSGAVTLMTLHAAKGLEFEVVAAVGLEEGLLPHQRSLESPDQMEEERRLLFVGITRAKRRLRLHHARYRTIRGVSERTIPSQFLRQLPEGEVECIDRSDEGEQDARVRSHPDLRKGTVVRHPQFGLGTVLGVAGRGSSARAKIRFNEAGVKTLVLEYARIEKVR